VPKGATAPTSPRKPKLGSISWSAKGRRCALWRRWRCFGGDGAGDWAGPRLSHRPAGTKGAAADCGGIGPRPSAQLRMKFNMQPNVEIIEGDILTIELNTVFG